MSGCGCEMEARNARERQTLQWVLGINAFMFVFEIVLGLLAQSTGLIADSLDMLADASVYAISLYAVGKSNALKFSAARLSGFSQIALAMLVLADVIRRFIYGSEPVSTLMMATGFMALLANILCLKLIAQHRNDGVHMRASLIFSKNDVIANIGIIISGIAVWAFSSRYPDLLIGTAIALLVLRGGFSILQEAAKDKSSGSSCSNMKE